MTAGTGAGQVGVRHGRRPPAKTEVHDWVTLSGVSAGAVMLYTLLRMHVSRSRDDDLVWTSTLTLATLMGLSRGDKISGYLAELEQLKAIEISAGRGNRNVYLVHAIPPAGYPGCLSLKDWYAQHKALVELKRAAEKEKRDARREAKRAAEGQSVTPETGQHPPGGVTPKTGELVTPKRGRPVTPKRGREPKRGFEPPGTGTTPTPPGSPPPEPEQEQESGPAAPPTPDPAPAAVPPWAALSADERDLHDELVRLRPDWSPVTLARVLADPLIRARPDRDLVRRAFLIGAATPGTFTPNRLLHDGCRHWSQAVRQRDGTESDAPVRRVGDVPWCGDGHCDSVTRELVDDEGRTRVDRAPCPRCHPAAVVA